MKRRTEPVLALGSHRLRRLGQNGLLVLHQLRERLAGSAVHQRRHAELLGPFVRPLDDVDAGVALVLDPRLQRLVDLRIDEQQQ